MRQTFVIALLSFVAFCSRLFTGRQSAVHAQDPFGTNEVSLAFRPRVPELGIAVPKVVPLANIRVSNNLVVGNETQPPLVVKLDGIETSNDVYSSPTGVRFEYGGGAFKLENVIVGDPIELDLVGAAANTAQLLKDFGMLGSPPYRAVLPPVESVKRNIPHKIKTTIDPRKPLSGDLASPFDGNP